MNEFFNRDEIRRKVIGLGESSTQKSYYPQLQDRIDELEQQQELLNKTNEELRNSLEAIQKMQKALTKSEYKYRALYENAYDPIFMISCDNYQIMDCNTKALNFLNINDKKNILSYSVVDIFPEYQANGKLSLDLAKDIVIKAKRGEPQIFEWLFKIQNKKTIQCIVTINYTNLFGDNLIQAVVRDISEIRKLEHKLGMASMRTIEKERLRFAKELHDGIGPILSTIKLYISWLKEDDKKAENELVLNKAADSIVEATNAIKSIAHNLSPHILTNYGFETALEQFIENITIAHPIKVEFKCNLKERLHTDFEILLYRVYTELINNTLKYANAKNIEIEIKRVKDSLTFKYLDDGDGFSLKDINTEKKGMGIYNIQNRIKKVGGFVDIDTTKGKGVNYNFYIHDLNYLDEIRKNEDFNS